MRSMNYLVALFFAVDAVMKMIAQGVLLTPTAYFQVWPIGQSASSFVAILHEIWSFEASCTLKVFLKTCMLGIITTEGISPIILPSKCVADCLRKTTRLC